MIKKEDWQKKLTPEQYKVTRQKATERPFTGEYNNSKEDGIYACVCCGAALFDSDSKFDSGTGWPSFRDVTSSENVSTVADESYGMKRTEVVCAQCNAHLGHVFDDGSPPTGLRYCINSISLKFKNRKDFK